MNKLESHGAFPLLAWILVASFAFFVYNLTVSLQDERNFLNEQRAYTEMVLDGQHNI